MPTFDFSVYLFLFSLVAKCNMQQPVFYRAHQLAPEDHQIILYVSLQLALVRQVGARTSGYKMVVEGCVSVGCTHAAVDLGELHPPPHLSFSFKKCFSMENVFLHSLIAKFFKELKIGTEECYGIVKT